MNKPRVISIFMRGNAASPDAASADDLSFQHVALVVDDVDHALAVLREQVYLRVVSREPQTIPPSNPVAAGVRAIYLRTRCGHAVELLSFPPDKGDARWHEPARELVRGIDHTALVCGSTERSLAFYRDRLGFEVVAESLNEGAEQEALTGVPGARVRVTSLRGADGPGIELLEYLSPTARTGRRWSPWTTTIAVSGRGDLSKITRDPDGHPLHIIEAP